MTPVENEYIITPPVSPNNNIVPRSDLDTTRHVPRTRDYLNTLNNNLNLTINEAESLRTQLDFERSSSSCDRLRAQERMVIIQNIQDILFENSEMIPCGLYVQLMNALIKK